MIEHIFDNFYYKLIVVIFLCFIITFVSNFDVLHSYVALFVMFVIITMMVYSNNPGDYNMILLLVALAILTFNMVLLKKKDNAV